MKNSTLQFFLILLIFSSSISFASDKKDKKNILKTSKTEISDLTTVKKIIGYNIQNSPVVSVNAEAILNKSAATEDSIPNILIELDFQDNIWATTYSERNITNTGWDLFLLLETYHNDNILQPDSMIYSDVDTINGGWDAVRKEVLYYNAAGLDTTLISYLYNEESGVWEFETKNNYSYDGNENQTQDIFWVWDPDNLEWMLWTKNIYKYNSNLLTEDEYLIWDDYNLNWLSASKTTYEYDNLNRIQTQTDFQSDFIGGFEEFSMEKYVYVGNTENIDTVMSFYYDSETETYTPDWFDKMNYSTEHGMIISDDTYSPTVDESKSAAENIDFTKTYAFVYYYNDTPTSVKANPEAVNLIYPNPANNKVILQINNPGNCRLEVFNLQGQLMLTKNIHAQITPVNIENLENGIYIFNVKNNGKSTTKKIVKQ